MKIEEAFGVMIDEIIKIKEEAARQSTIIDIMGELVTEIFIATLGEEKLVKYIDDLQKIVENQELCEKVRKAYKEKENSINH